MLKTEDSPDVISKGMLEEFERLAPPEFKATRLLSMMPDCENGTVRFERAGEEYLLSYSCWKHGSRVSATEQDAATTSLMHHMIQNGAQDNVCVAVREASLLVKPKGCSDYLAACVLREWLAWSASLAMSG
ncbi:MAG: hypothetical protein AAB563_00065 [Patescibacteria group bacterium]|mgnify:CR=1 FL=1